MPQFQGKPETDSHAARFVKKAVRQATQPGSQGDNLHTQLDLAKFIREHTLFSSEERDGATDFGGGFVSIKPNVGSESKLDFIEFVKARFCYNHFSQNGIKLALEPELPGVGIGDVFSWLFNKDASQQTYEACTGFMALAQHYGLGTVTITEEKPILTFNAEAAKELNWRVRQSSSQQLPAPRIS